MDTRLKKVVAFVILAIALVAVAYGTYLALEATWVAVEVPEHSIGSHSLGFHQQGEEVRARVVIDEGSVKVLEGRYAIVQLVDSDNRASLEKGEGYAPVAELRIDVRESSFPGLTANEGSISYTAHRTDTYYLVYRNEDWWDLDLLVADGDAQDQQFTVKAFATALFLAVLSIFPWAYGRAFDVNVRRRLGLVRRPRGPGSRSAQESPSEEAAAEEMVLEAEE